MAVLAGALLCQTPTLPESAVFNAASGSPSVAAGSLVAIFGSELASSVQLAASATWPTVLADVSVTFNGVLAALYYVSAGQINSQMPWNTLAAGVASGTASVVVRRGAASSQPRTVQVAAFSPAIFTATGSGAGQAIAINLDGTLAAPEGSIPGLNTHPVERGGAVVILCNGLGSVNPPAQTGSNSLDTLRRTTTMPRVLVGARPADIFFSGLSPEFPGVNQLNVAIPADAPVGSAVPLQIEIGGITTSALVTIAVR